MAITTGQTGVVKVGDTNTGETAVGSVRSFSIETSADTVEQTVMGNTNRSFLPSLTSATVSIEAYWDDTDSEQLALDEGEIIFFEIYPQGDVTSKKYYTGAGVVTSRSITASFDGMVEASFTIQASTAITEATV
tara:strand:- start:683 stop:1084 length:402 start_codon:yes stop_codon:yes gene_type:complete